MQRTQELALDFTTTQHGEAFCGAFSGDIHSNVFSLTVTPALSEGDILLCSFLRNNLVVDTLVVQNNTLTVPYSVLKNPGEYTAAFAVANLQNRLTAPILLTVRVAEDRLSLVPTEDYGDDQSLICYILTQTAETARATATTVATATAQTVITPLATRVGVLEDAAAAAQTRLTAAEADIDALQASALRHASGTATLTASDIRFCNSPFCRWTRFGNVVIVSFGFLSTSSVDFLVSGLPFNAALSYLAAPIAHVIYSESGVTLPTDKDFDFCQTVVGTKQMRVIRKGSGQYVLSGTLIYLTDDPFPA